MKANKASKKQFGIFFEHSADRKLNHFQFINFLSTALVDQSFGSLLSSPCILHALQNNMDESLMFILDDSHEHG